MARSSETETANGSMIGLVLFSCSAAALALLIAFLADGGPLSMLMGPVVGWAAIIGAALRMARMKSPQSNFERKTEEGQP